MTGDLLDHVDLELAVRAPRGQVHVQDATLIERGREADPGQGRANISGARMAPSSIDPLGPDSDRTSEGSPRVDQPGVYHGDQERVSRSNSTKRATARSMP